eukprot:6206624-Pleurochrysis_carterae.AAC.1
MPSMPGVPKAVRSALQPSSSFLGTLPYYCGLLIQALKYRCGYMKGGSLYFDGGRTYVPLHTYIGCIRSQDKYASINSSTHAPAQPDGKKKFLKEYYSRIVYMSTEIKGGFNTVRTVLEEGKDREWSDRVGILPKEVVRPGWDFSAKGGQTGLGFQTLHFLWCLDLKEKILSFSGIWLGPARLFQVWDSFGQVLLRRAHASA